MKEQYLVQIIMSFFGSLGFAVIFGIWGKRLLLVAFGGAAGWGICLLVQFLNGNLFTSLFIGTAAMAVFSEIMARRLYTPTTILLVPMLIPMIPGGDLYYTMYYLITKQTTELAVSAQKLLEQAGAIALGILVTAYIVRSVFVSIQHA